MSEDARSNEGHFSHLQSDEVAEISMGPTATRGEEPIISITSNNHCPLRDPYILILVLARIKLDQYRGILLKAQGSYLCI